MTTSPAIDEAREWTPSAAARLRPLSIALLLIAIACGDDAASGDDMPAQTDSGIARADAQASCGDAGDGTECGDDRHCVAGRCLFNSCGDGIRAGAEACDDGNEAVGDGCDPACEKEPGPRCGDGEMQDDEECDDGNVHDLDDCTNECTLNLCGNGRQDAAEECDDGNLANGDECSATCAEIRCRNGRIDPGEECDDGNRIHDDGCSNACRIVVCGNGNVEGDEECDDANDVDGDACASACTANVCGNGRLDPGEACDGSTVEYACAADCRSTVDDDCRPCEEEFCSVYQGVDWVAGCFAGEAPPDLVPEVDPRFAQDCIDVVECARRTGCGFDPNLPPALDCYCGAISVDACNVDGPDAAAPCADEWRAATRGATNTDVLTRISDATLPSGWAYFLMLCDREHCAEECLP